MRDLTLRRTAFAATLVSGLSLTAFAFHGVSQVDTTLQLAADTARERPALVSEPKRSWECDGYRGSPARRV